MGDGGGGGCEAAGRAEEGCYAKRPLVMYIR